MRYVYVLGFIIGMIFIIAFSCYGTDCKKAEEIFSKALNMKGFSLKVLLKKEVLYRKALKLCPTHAPSWNNLGDIYERQGRYREAIECYKKAIKLKPEASYPYAGLGDIYFKTGRYKEAEKYYKMALKIDPKDALSSERLKQARLIRKEIEKNGVIRARTIKEILNGNIRAVGEVVSLTFSEGLIPFDFDKAEIREDAKRQLNEIGKALEALFHPRGIAGTEEIPFKIEVAGHADPRGTDEYNLNLSRRRAEAVINYLVTNFNIPRDKLIPNGYGERRPLCTEWTEACHALNRRVELIRREEKNSRGIGGTMTLEPLKVETGFFYKKEEEKFVKPIRSGKTSLRSYKDRYFIFFRPLQDCYVYLLQEDARGNINLLYPKKGQSAFVKKGQDYWVPCFGKGFTLDDTRGQEKLYLVVTSWSVEEFEGKTLEEKVYDTVRSLKSRTIYIVKASSKPEAQAVSEEIFQNSNSQNSNTFNTLLERIEGEGGWVRIVEFKHE